MPAGRISETDFRFYPVSLLIIDRNSPIPYPRRRRRNTISMAFPRPGVAMYKLLRLQRGVLDSDIQFPRFVDFVVEKEKRERE